MANKILINPTTLAVNSNSFSTINGNTTSLTCSNLTGTEVVKVQIWHEANAGGGAFIDYIINGILQKFDITNVVIEIWNSSLTYRIVKPTTVNSVGVAINTTSTI